MINGSSPLTFDPFNADDLEPGVRQLLERRLARKLEGEYVPRPLVQVMDALERFLAGAAPGAHVHDLGRLGGGASKEQFAFRLGGEGDLAGRYVLRMEPRESVSEADRQREFNFLQAAQGVVPAPVPMWIDPDGAVMGQPAAIMRFSSGVTKPAQSGATVTGLGTILGDRLRQLIGPQFIECLVAIHRLDWSSGPLSIFDVPRADPRQAALWQLNWWSRVWREDSLQGIPAIAVAERWMRRNLPETQDLVMVHGDYRTGNYLFDEESGKITAILDWELGHIGDRHEDLAWAIQRPLESFENGRHFSSGLYTRDELIAAYEDCSKSRVDLDTLRFYEIFSAYKCVVIILGTGLKIARDHHNHQDALLTWLAAVGHIFHHELCRLLRREDSE